MQLLFKGRPVACASTPRSRTVPSSILSASPPSAYSPAESHDPSENGASTRVGPQEARSSSGSESPLATNEDLGQHQRCRGVRLKLFADSHTPIRARARDPLQDGTVQSRRRHRKAPRSGTQLCRRRLRYSRCPKCCADRYAGGLRRARYGVQRGCGPARKRCDDCPSGPIKVPEHNGLHMVRDSRRTSTSDTCARSNSWAGDPSQPGGLVRSCLLCEGLPKSRHNPAQHPVRLRGVRPSRCGTPVLRGAGNALER